MSVRILYALVWKDLQVFLADRRAMIVSFVLPIAMASFFGFLFQGRASRAESSRIPIRVVDQDDSPVSRQLVGALGLEKALAVEVATAAEGRTAVRKGRAAVAAVIPPGF